MRGWIFGIAALTLAAATPGGATEQPTEAMRPKEVAFVQGTTGTSTQEPVAKTAAKPSAAPVAVKPATAAPAMAAVRSPGAEGAVASALPAAPVVAGGTPRP